MTKNHEITAEKYVEISAADNVLIQNKSPSALQIVLADELPEANTEDFIVLDKMSTPFIKRDGFPSGKVYVKAAQGKKCHVVVAE